MKRARHCSRSDAFETGTSAYPIQRQSMTEELLNCLSHGTGLILSIAATVVLAVLCGRGTPTLIVSCMVYGASLISLYLASTLYHACWFPEGKRKLRILDHASIYLLIAGTYTPFTLLFLPPAWGWSLFGVVWGLALVGIILKLFFTGRCERLSMITYVLMGWVVVVAIQPLLSAIPMNSFFWLLLGGILYTAGIVFYARDSRRYFHSIWHLFVLGGSISQFVAVLQALSFAKLL